MSERRWIINASPLILLGKIAQLELLPCLSTHMLIPAGVITEIQQGTVNDVARQWLTKIPQDQIANIPHIHPTVAAWNLGRGEAEVLSFAVFNPGYTVVIDDLAARNCATSLCLPMLGTLGLLLLAKKDRLIECIAPLINSLQLADMRLNSVLIAKVLALAGE